MTGSPTPPQADTAMRYLAWLCALMMWLGILGPAWNYSPGSAAANLPPAVLDFAGMAAVLQNGPPVIQAAFFGWMAWVFALVTTILALLAIRGANAILGGACIVIGIAELVLTVFGFKGSATWATVFDTIEYVRIGAVMFVVGILLLIAIGVRCVIRANALPNLRAGATSVRTGTA